MIMKRKGKTSYIFIAISTAIVGVALFGAFYALGILSLNEAICCFVFNFPLFSLLIFICNEEDEREAFEKMPTDFYSYSLQIFTYLKFHSDRDYVHTLASEYIEKVTESTSKKELREKALVRCSDFYEDFGLDKKLKDFIEGLKHQAPYDHKLLFFEYVCKINKASGYKFDSLLKDLAFALSLNGDDATRIKNENSDHRKTKEFLLLSIALMAKVMYVDWSNMVCELDIIKAFIWKHDKEHFQTWMKELKDIVKNIGFKINVASTIDLINEKFVYAQKEELLFCLFDVAYADGKCTYEETELLKRFVAELTGMEYSYYEAYYKREQDSRRKSWDETKSEWKSKTKDSRSDFDEDKNSNESDSSQSKSSYRNISTELQKAYAVLNIPVDATDSELRACRRNFMRINHPDLFANRGAEAVEKATLKCQDFNKAFDIVKKSRGM